MKTILEFLDSRMKTPSAYTDFETSWFHYLSLFLMIITIFLLIKHFKKDNIKKVKKTVLILGLVMIVLEIYKQIIFTYQDGKYQWYAFPFQFCSTPMYLYIILGLTKNKKLESFLISFLATYGTFAGLAVMIYPSSVFVSTIGINIQTMVHHGLIAAVGLALLIKIAPMNIKTLFRGLITFTVLVAIAYTLNTSFNVFINTETFNMFFINPKYGTEIPVLASIEPNVPHFIFLIIYIIGFSLMAVLMFTVSIFIKKYFFKEVIELSNVFSY